MLTVIVSNSPSEQPTAIARSTLSLASTVQFYHTYHDPNTVQCRAQLQRSTSSIAPAHLNQNSARALTVVASRHHAPGTPLRIVA